jgi:hypothetical protein
VIASHLREIVFRLGQCWTYTAAPGTPNSTANAPNSRMIVIRLISMLRKVQQPCLGRTSSTGGVVTPNQDLEALPNRSVLEEAVLRAESKQAVIEAVYEDVSGRGTHLARWSRLGVAGGARARTVCGKLKHSRSDLPCP